MNRLLLGIFAILFASLVTSSPLLAAIEVQPLPKKLPDSPVLITGYQFSGNTVQFVQLYNNSSSLLDISGWQVEYAFANNESEKVITVPLKDWLLPRTYAVVGFGDYISGGDVTYRYDFNDLENMNIISIRLMSDNFLPYQVPESTLKNSGRYELTKTNAGNYTTTSQYKVVGDNNSPLYGGGLYAPPQDVGVRVVEIAANPKSCAPLNTSPACFSFIKLHNNTNQAIDLSRLRLRFGHANQSAGIANTVALQGTLMPSQYYAVVQRNDEKPLQLSASAGSVWLEDVQGLMLYEPTLYTYSAIGGSAFKGYSWAQDSRGVWRWAQPSPFGENNFAVPNDLGQSGQSTQKPCRADQYRNPQTNRCRLRTSAATTQKPCLAHQVRNPVTNRCKSILAGSVTLKPCRSDQTRNPETNRCRNVATSEPKPCKENQYRHPETNRCRNKVTMPTNVAFAPEAVEPGKDTFVGWWMLGGLGSVALGRLGWEWREEGRRLAQGVWQFVRGKK